MRGLSACCRVHSAVYLKGLFHINLSPGELGEELQVNYRRTTLMDVRTTWLASSPLISWLIVDSSTNGSGTEYTFLKAESEASFCYSFLKGTSPRPAAGPAPCFPVGVSYLQWPEDTPMLSQPYKLLT